MPLKEAHCAYQEDHSSSNQSEDHTLLHDYYSGPPNPQPGSYPHGEQLTSRNTMYANLQDSLMTQREDLLMQGKVEMALHEDVITAEED